MPPAAQGQIDSAESASPAETASGQDLIYGGQFDAAHLYFTKLALRFPRDPVGPALAASALIWQGAAIPDDQFMADSVDTLLAEAAARADRGVREATTDSARVAQLFWLGTALGYRARQADLHGHPWRASHEAQAMRAALERALALDSSCVDCQLGLAVYDYALARASAIARLVARILGLGGGDAELALARMRHVQEQGALARYEARWLYANALVRESGSDTLLKLEARRLVGDLATRFPDNPVFRRFLDDNPAPQ